ncbi:MAG: hypothetical protein HYS87_03255 [Candidatus Colwellbacteria bacterium]|nr:hypothetical protein [Candidatus Colwellbacteria bacterium]
MEKPLITIPERDAPVTGMPPEVKSRFDKIDNILIAVVASVLVSLVAVIISVIGLFLDQMRYNNAAYSEYSGKIESVETTQKINEEFLRQVQELSEQNKEQLEIIKKLLEENYEIIN